MESINRSMAKGVLWTVLFKFVVRGIGLISTVVLARLLMPADFGLVAMATIVIAALDLLSSFNVDTVLIQHRNPERKHYDTAWTFNVIAGAGQAAVLFAMAPVIAHFYDEPRLVAIVAIIAFCRLIGGFENIGIVAFRKELQFHIEFKLQVYRKLIGFAATMILAFTFRSYWALVGGMFTLAVASVVLSYTMHPYRPRFCLAALSELFHFSKWLLVNNVLYFVIHDASGFIVGKFGGPKQLGLYQISYEVSNLPSTDLVAPINRAIFPGYSKMAGDMNVLRQGFLNVLSGIAVVVLPIGLGITLLAEPLVRVMLGEQWLEAAPLIGILSIAGILNALGSNQGAALLALGRPRVLTLMAALQALVLVPLLLWGATTRGAHGAAEATLASIVIMTPINLAIVLRNLELRASRVAQVLWRPLVAGAVMAPVVWAASNWLPGGASFAHAVAQLVVCSVAGGLVYVGVVLALWKAAGMPDGVEQILVSRALDALRRRRGPAIGT